MEVVKRGKVQVIGIIVILLLMEVITIIPLILAVIEHGMMIFMIKYLFKNYIRLMLTGFLLFFLYKGYQWAKWLIIGLCILNGMISFIIVQEWKTFIMSLIVVCIGIRLIFSKSINTFLLYQRGHYQLSQDNEIV